MIEVRRRKVPPTIATPAIPAAHELRVKRGKVIGEINQLQWEFDRRPTANNAAKLSELRNTVNDLELIIAEISQEHIIRDQVLRSMMVMEGILGPEYQDVVTDGS